MKTIDRRMMIKSVLGTAGAAIVLPAVFSREERAARGDGMATASAPAASQAAAPMPFDTNKIEVTNLAPGLELLTGPGGNIAVLHGKDGTLVIDCGVPSRSKDVLAAIKEIATPKRVVASISPAITMEGALRFLINTHWHFDHTGGNEALAAAGATIVAHENTYKRLSEDTTIEFFKMTSKAVPESARPVVTFAESNVIRLNGEVLTLTHVPPAHTDGDIFIHFKKADVIHGGDVVFNGVYPFIDYSTGGNVSGMIGGVDAILKVAGEKTKIIPGHGAMADVAYLKKYRDMMADVQKAVRGLIAAGKDEEGTIAAKPTAAYDKDFGGGMVKGDVFAKLVYRIEKKG